MEINGLPLHALVIHAAVVLTPLAALAGLAYAGVPRWRDWLRVPFAVVVVLSAVSVWVSYFSGQSVVDANAFYGQGEVAAMIETHADRAGLLRVFASLFAVLGVVATWWHARTGPVRLGLLAAVGVLAVLTATWTVLTGDAGAQIAWSGIEG